MVTATGNAADQCRSNRDPTPTVHLQKAIKAAQLQEFFLTDASWFSVRHLNPCSALGFSRFHRQTILTTFTTPSFCLHYATQIHCPCAPCVPHGLFRRCVSVSRRRRIDGTRSPLTDPLISLLTLFKQRDFDGEGGLIFAREYDFADALEMRDFDDELEMRALDDELETRDFDDELEMRGFDEDLLEIREFDELDARDLEDLFERGLYVSHHPASSRKGCR
jgi:hypothetical protein